MNGVGTAPLGSRLGNRLSCIEQEALCAARAELRASLALAFTHSQASRPAVAHLRDADGLNQSPFQALESFGVDSALCLWALSPKKKTGHWYNGFQGAQNAPVT